MTKAPVKNGAQNNGAGDECDLLDPPMPYTSRRLPIWQLYERARSLGLAVQVSMAGANAIRWRNTHVQLADAEGLKESRPLSSGAHVSRRRRPSGYRELSRRLLR